MKRLLILASALLFAPLARAQFTSVTAAVKDPSGSPYVGCHAEADFVPASTATTQPLINGSVFPTSVTLAQCDSFGNASWSLVDNNQVSDGHSGSASQWRFSITSQDGKTGFPCTITITGATQNISAALQACAAPLPPSGGGGGNFVVKTIPCASSINFTMAGVSPNTSNTAFVINPLNCNVTTSAVVPPTGGVLQQGAVAQFTFVNAGGFSFTWPSNFTDTPTIQSGVNVTTNASFWYDGTNWHAQTFPAAGGGGGNPVGTQGTIQSTNGTTFASSNLSEPPSGALAGKFKVNEDVAFCGPNNPYVDPRCFGFRSVNPNTAPATTGITATCTATQFTCSLSSSSTFVNGDGVTVFGAGAAQSMTTPSAPTVTPSIALAGTCTGCPNTPSAAGATTYNYKIVARDKNGGLTAASAAGSTATGQATLGAVTVNITSQTRSGVITTLVMSAAHPVLVGCAVAACGESFNSSNNSLTDTTFNGWFQYASATDSTHLTYRDRLSTTNGATTSAIGGTATFYLLNKVTYSQVTGAVQYALYSDRAVPGTFALVGISNPSTSVNADLEIDDYGSPFQPDNWLFPYIYPANAPASATSDSLTTTIASGAGTTTLTLANAVGTTVTTQPILFDDGPALVAAGNSITNGYGAVRIPADGSGNVFVINSWTTMPSTASVIPDGPLYLNDTLEFPSNGAGGIKFKGDFVPQFGAGASSACWSSNPSIGVNRAHPGILFSAGQFDLLMRAFTISSLPANGTLGILVDGGFNQSLEQACFTTGFNASDYLGQGIQFRGSVGQANSNVALNYVGFSPGGVGDGSSHSPTAYFRGSGEVDVHHSYSIHRGMLYTGNATFHLGTGDTAYINGGGTPLLTQFFAASNGALIHVGAVVLDTISHPCVAAYPGNAGFPSIVFDGSVCTPGGGVVAISGHFASVTAPVAPAYAFANASFGNLAADPNDAALGTLAGGGWRDNINRILGGNASLFTAKNPMAAPTCTVSAGGSLATGSYTFQTAEDWVLGKSTASPSSSTCTATTGNQTITVTWVASAGSPVGYEVYTSGLVQHQTSGVGSTCGPPFIPGGATTSWVLNTALTNCGTQPLAVPTGGPSIIESGTQGLAAPQWTLTGGGFTDIHTFSGTANRTVTWPDASGTVALAATSPITLSAAGTMACANCFNLSTSNNIGANFFDVGTRAGPGNPASGNIRLYADSTSGNLTCLTSAGANCIPGGGGGTPGGSTTQVQFNSAGAFAGSANFTWVSPTLTLGVNAAATGQLALANGGASGLSVTIQNPSSTTAYNFNLPTGAGTSGQPLISGGGGAAAQTYGTLGYGGGGTGGTAFTANQLVQSGASALSSVAGSTTGTNPIVKLQPSSAANTALILDTAATPTGDVQDWNINGTKTSWVDSSAFVHTPQVTFTGSGALTLNGTNGTCPSSVAGNSIICLGDSTTQMGLLSNNGGNFKPIAQFNTAGPTAHGVGLASVTAPQIVFSGAGITGQPFTSGGASADGAYAALNLAGGSNIVTGLLPPGNGGTGASSLAGANIVTVTGAITAGHCTSWNASTVVQDSGAACGGGSSPARLDQITAGTATNTINSTTFAQTWNWALTGSTTAFKFGENTAATGSNNILVQATTANASTAVPFQTDNNGNGYQLSSTGLWKPVGTGSVALPGTTHGVIVGEGPAAAIAATATGTAGQVLISNGASSDPTFQDPVVSQAFVNIWNAQDITVTRTSANVRNPIFSQTATLQLTFASVTGSPSGCTLQFRGVDSQGNVLNNGGTVSISPANGTTSQTFTAAATLQTAAQVSAVYACSVYPSAGTLTLDFTPIPNVNVTNTVATTNNVTQFGGANVSTGTGASGAGIPRVTISNDSSLAANQSVNVNQVGGSAVSTAATGVQKVGVTGNAGAAMDAAGQNVASPANELLVGCQFNTAPTTITSGNMSPTQCDNGGKMLVNVGTPAVTQSGNWTTRVVGNVGAVVDQAPGSAVPANVVMEGLSDGTNSRRALSDTTGRQFMLSYPDTTTTSYHTSKKFALSSTTDIVVMPGNATNTVLVTKILFTCTQTTAGTVNVELIKRSTADSAGTSAAMTAVPDDSNYAAAVSAPLSYTGTGPTVGTAVGDLDNAQVGCPATSVAGPNDLYMFRPIKPVILRGTAQQVTINLGGAVTGGTGTVTIEWYETTTP